MKRYGFIPLIILMIAAAVAIYEWPFRTNYVIYTGTTNGTFFAMGNDIARECPKLSISVKSSEGSLENIASILKPSAAGNFRFAIVQSDILGFALSFDKNSNELYKTAWPFYKAELNVVVNRASGIKTIFDLAGKKVAGGALGTGSWYTTNNLKKVLGVQWTSVFSAPNDSVNELIKGNIDAIVVIGGAPMGYLKLDSSKKDQVQLLPIVTPLMRSYETSIIPAQTYPWQFENVETKAIRSLMIASSTVPDSAINKLRSCVAEKLPDLKATGHPKWKEITAQQVLSSQQ